MSVAVHCLVILAGLLLPGLGWARGARWPAPWLAAGVISALAIFVGVTGLALSGVAPGVANLSVWLALVAIGGAVFARRNSPTPAAPAPTADRAEWWLLAPALPTAAVAVWRVTAEPLAGFDVDFRWHYLAEHLVQTGRLDYFPPFSAADFQQYFWIDGFPPLVSSVYAWTYLVAGSVDKHWSALPVLLQLAGLVALLHALGNFWSGVRGGRLAVAAAGACFLLISAFDLGQESGAVALGAAGMVFYLVAWQREGRAALLVPAALCGALVAGSREYGFAFPLAAGAVLVGLRAGFMRAGGFVALALALPAAWYARNWMVTGNPLYSLNVAGIFPVNPIFDAWMIAYRALYRWPLHEAAGWLAIGRYVVIGMIPAAAGLIAGAWHGRRQGGAAIVGVCVAVNVVAWLASVPYTAGGLFYSMRVLTPLLVCGCAAAGATLAGQPHRFRIIAVVALLALGSDAALRTLTVPANPYEVPTREWLAAGYAMQRKIAAADAPFLFEFARRGHGKVLSESVGAVRPFQAAGRPLVPLWSPEVSFLYGPSGAADAASRLRALGYSHLLLTRGTDTLDFLARTGALDRLGPHLKIEAGNETYVIYAITD